MLGLLVGYFLLRRAAPSVARTQPAASVATASAAPSGHPKLTLEQMKQMADLQASTLIEKSKPEPKKCQPAGADCGYLPEDPSVHSGDVDGAVNELNQALKYNPNHANSLFNLGMIKYRGKKDAAGAVAVWQELLKTNPNLDRKPIVEQMIAEARGSQRRKKTDKRGHKPEEL